MPLERAAGESFIAYLDAIQFEMVDTTTRKTVMCNVAFDALRNRGTRDGRYLIPIEDLFLAYRVEVENIASALYDEGHTRPYVSSARLCAPG